MPERSPGALTSAPRLIVLSAQTPERLQAVVRQLGHYLEGHHDVVLADLAYTLQVGREAMASRLAMVVHDTVELSRGVQSYLQQGQPGAMAAAVRRPVPWYAGHPDNEPAELETLLVGSTGEGLVRVLLAGHNLEKLALYWAKGGRIPWPALHQDGPCRLLALPLYPFAGERYWVPAPPETQSPAPPSLTTEAASLAVDTAPFTVRPEHSRRDNIQRYLLWFLGQEHGLTPEQISLAKGLRSYGVDSITRTRLIQGFATFFRIEVTGRDLLAANTLHTLIRSLAEKTTTTPTG